MKGLIIWAQSDCRSTMGLYQEIQKLANFPVVIALWHYSGDKVSSDNRTSVGFSSEEFKDVRTERIGENFEAGLRLIEHHRGWNHLFCAYQTSRMMRQLAKVVNANGDRYGIMSESPCNMKAGFKAFLWEIYIRTKLRLRVRWIIKNADFFINFSGYDKHNAKILGWKDDKIVPFGYYPPPIEQSNLVSRSINKPFFILSTGILSRYRGADVLVKALKILKDKNVEYRAVITQNGELLEYLKDYATKNALPIEFPGFISMKELLALYESCSVYVGAGRNEPWGMRLNDALNCGAPLVVSDGMGGVRMVRDFGCGVSFKRGDSNDLAEKLYMLITSENKYLECARKVNDAVKSNAPEEKARMLLQMLRKVWH